MLLCRLILVGPLVVQAYSCPGPLVVQAYSGRPFCAGLFLLALVGQEQGLWHVLQ